MTTHDLTTADLAPATDHRQEQSETEPDAEPVTDSQGQAKPGMSIPGSSTVDPAAPLFEPRETEQFRTEWLEVQSGFVDQPRESVERADCLVAEVMQRLAAQFAEGRATLERGWDESADVSTEELRVTMTRYRSFFERLLNA